MIARAAAAADQSDVTFFEEKVRPLLVAHCYECHSTEAKELGGNLLLDTRAGWQNGGDNGPPIVPGKPKASLILRAVGYADENLQMPPKGKLAQAEIEILTKWIEQGAPDPREGEAAKAPLWTIDIAEGRKYWAFQPLAEVEPPTGAVLPARRDETKHHAERDDYTAIDRLIDAKLAEKKLSRNPPADRRVLLRRAYLTVTGLPPTSDEVQAFETDTSPDAWERIVEGLLASPHYGERWGRHWLDLARFAESHGFEHDYDRPYAYHYRDFVIKALNQDLPYDTFVRWQLAGDEFEPDNPLALMATGFLANGVHATQITANQVEKERYDELDDMLATTGTAMLGLTIGCARCHDHKFDPIPNLDYYRLLSTFTTTVRSEMEINLDPEGFKQAKVKYDAEHAPLVAAVAKYQEEQLSKSFDEWLSGKSKQAVGISDLAKLPKPAQDALAVVAKAGAAKLTGEQRQALFAWVKTTDVQWQQLNSAVVKHAQAEPKLPKVLISSEGVPAVRLHTQGGDFLEKTHFLRRGDPNQKTGEATPGFLQVLMTAADGEQHWRQAPPAGWRTSYRRRALADWITDREHGAGHLLARVIVNRLWHYHFGRGIVATPSDFGAQGTPPSHPELLDWLARELIRNEWRLKPIQKLILTSAVYQQGSAIDPEKAAIDPDNVYLWRWSPRRLEAEAIRDSLLAVTGELDRTMYGPGTLDERMRRRSIYFTVKRSKLIPMLQLFDAPDANQGIGRRATTTVAPQALLLINSPIVRQWAQAMARRISIARATDHEEVSPAETLRRAFQMALARDPSDEELSQSLKFLNGQMRLYQAGGEHAQAAELALTDFCQTLLGLNEVVYVE
ncbi:MAG: PSD1 and planctomycete cytochrome C domain-containing protein [Pirellulales bacterium]